MSILKHSVLCLFCTAFAIAAIHLAAQDAAADAGTAGNEIPVAASESADESDAPEDVKADSKERIRKGAESLKHGAADIASGTASLVKAEFGEFIDDTEEFGKKSAEKVKSATKSGLDTASEYGKKGAEKVKSATKSGVEVMKEGVEELRNGARTLLGKDTEELVETDSDSDDEAPATDSDEAASDADAAEETP